MPLISSLSAGARAFGLYVLAALATVIDTFNRSDNATDLGSISGQKWKIWRGVWGISGNKAVSSTTASTYPLATLTFTKTDVTVSISGQDPGMGAAFWVTDAENWYATIYVQVESCQTCNNCNSWNASNCNQFSGGNPATYTCLAWTCNAYTCNAWTCTTSTCNSWFCNSGTTATWNPIFCSGFYNNPNCNAFFAYTCNCVTEHKINILSFIAGSISTLATYLYNSAIQSFKSIKSGNSVTVSAYSDTSWGTQIGSSNNYSITTPVKTRQHGIIKSPSSFGQGNSINEIRVD